MAGTKRSKKSGLPPGSVVHIGEKKIETPRITLMDYTPSQFTEKVVHSADECLSFRDNPSITWININGLSDTALIEQIGKGFNLHPLILEDIVNTEQRPKIEDFDNYLFMVLRMLNYDPLNKDIKSEQISLVLGHNFVLSFQEDIGDVWDGVRERIRNDKGRIRKEYSDYLAYSLMDAIVDNYFFILEKSEEDIEGLEEEIIQSSDKTLLPSIHHLKREMLTLRRSVWPLRETINSLMHSDNPLIHDTTRIYLRDIYDHTIQVIETIESLRDISSGLLDIYLSSVSNRLNEIMKVLTIISAIIMPLTLIAGIYGMNFEYMPELRWKWGYPGALILMVVIGTAMLLYIKRKKWF